MPESAPSIHAEWAKLLEYRRQSIPEVAIHGGISWVSGDKTIHDLGGAKLTYGRSLTKPFQMKGVAQELNAHLTPESKAISVASHGSEEPQLKAIQSILTTDNLKLIVTPLSSPLADPKFVGEKSRIFHPCSGKHAAILKACELNGWPLVGYTLPTHPFHQRYVAELRNVLGQNWQAKRTAKDGCGLPTVSMTIDELARLFSSLVKSRDEDWIWSAMTKHPELVGGKGRLDTAIMQASHGKVLAKEGADGLLGLAVLHKDHPDGLGIVIKIAHGWDPKAMGFVASAVLRSIGISFEFPASLERQQAFVSEAVVPEKYASTLRQILTLDTAPPIDDGWT